MKKKALSFLKKCDKKEARRIVDFLDQQVAFLEDVRAIGKPLRGQLSGLWRYRVEITGYCVIFMIKSLSC
ncbi:type II toxin-antitoxin system RelE/ParE family toxin [Bartonella sp. ML70XJBT.G]|uniref:type II toxin-antitoxin system RelE family toxin n=1 Tax=Bartonella sp. ML70XJBT.G TaxID=3019093 RepID=UPI002361C716|nr:type II toxin-antitoxin system RelE/ParE family toxin [Bartonella sp. ML70XJBT.G]